MFFLFLGAVWLGLVSSVSCESHYEYINYSQMLTRTVCHDYDEEVCSGWWLDYDCDIVKKQHCYTEYYIGTGVVTKCQPGWQPYPGNCDVPICDPPCEGGKACVDPNVCGCLASSGGLCSIVPCNDEDNCYPGTCKTSPNCTCPAPFAERNCIRILQLPDISSCKVQLYDGSQALTKEADCSPVGVAPQDTWIRNPALSKVKVVWEMSYVKPIGMPDATFAPHVANAPVTLGIRAASFNVSFSQGGGTDIITPCVIDQSIPPQHYKKCDVERTWSDYGVTPTHGLTFNVGAASQLGGFKEGSMSVPGSYFERTEFQGDPTYRRAQFKFDLKAPTHCLPLNKPEDCAQFPIFLDLDVRTNPVIQPKVYNWSDDGSGLVNYHIEVFYMQTSSDGLLDNVGAALIKADVKPELNNFYYQCQKPGVYSIELTVEDQAGNQAKARELFIYTDESGMTTDPAKPIYIAEANPGSGYTWITDVEYPEGGGPVRLTLTWTDHFKSEATFNEDWAAGVKPWSSDPSLIDDRYDKQYGVRTILPIVNMPHGIVGYSVAYTVDRSNGGSGLSPDNWTAVEATKDRFALSVPDPRDGDAVVVWLRCYDATGSVATEKRIFNVDTTSPDVSKQEFAQKSVDEYTSTVSVTVIDTAGGIKNISYEIYDRTVKQTVHTGIQLPQTREPPPRNSSRSLEQACSADDQTCYCIPNGTCYNTIQKIDIDHCWIDLFAGDFFEFRYTVANLGDLTKKEMLELGVLTEIPCRPSPGLSPGEIAGIVIGTIGGVLLIIVLVMLIRIYVFKKPPPSRFTAVHRTIQNRFSQPKTEENIVYAGGGGDNLGTGTNKLNSNAALERSGKAAAKHAYSGPEDSQSSNQSTNTVERKHLDFGEALSEGRYAIVRKAHLHRGNESVVVAAKSAKGRCSEEDKILFATKISMLERLVPHPNIVKFIGRVEEDPNEELTMIMEYCEISLKNWLDNVQKVDSEILEQMMNFTLDIAKALLHLHNSKVIHRRLAIRNVLLKERSGEYIAKLIGFGPNREDVSNNSEQLVVPIKWLAPETLDTLNSKTPKYDVKTDAWSFGITVWEIYSKGASPYSDHRSGEIGSLLKTGFRMSRPDDCPPELFDNVVSPCWRFDPKARPTVSSICSSISRFRNGPEPVGYYAAGGQAVPAPTGYYDASQLHVAQAAYDQVYVEVK